MTKEYATSTLEEGQCQFGSYGLGTSDQHYMIIVLCEKNVLVTKSMGICYTRNPKELNHVNLLSLFVASSMNMIGLFSLGKGKCMFFLVAIDGFTKWNEVDL